MGIFDIKNTDIFSKDYDSPFSSFVHSLKMLYSSHAFAESFDESDENNFWDYLKKNK